MCFLFRIAKKIKPINCINVSKKSGLAYCTGCNIIVGLYEGAEENEVISYFNVREVLFRPHTSYTTHFATNEKSAQHVIYTEMVEHGERCFTEDLDVVNVFVFPIVDLSVESAVDMNQPSTSSGSANPVIRVAAFASESLINIDENRITKHFKDAITNDLKRQFEEDVANVSNTVWSTPQSLTPNENETGSCVQRTGVRSTDFDLTEFLVPRADDKQTDCSEIDLDFFD